MRPKGGKRREDYKEDDYDRLLKGFKKETLHQGSKRVKTVEEKSEKERQERQISSGSGDLDITNCDEFEEKQSELKKSNKDLEFSENLIEGEIAKPKKSTSQKPMEKIPFVLDIPDTLEDFQELVLDRPTKDQLEIIQRIRKSNHIRLNKEENASKMQRFFGMLLEHFKSLCFVEPLSMPEFDVASRAIFALSHDLPEVAAGIARGNLIVIQKRLEQTGTFPTGLYFKLVSNYFPMSDFSHPISNSLMLVLGYCLSRCEVSSKQDVVAGVYICTLLLNCVKESKRYVPEVVAFLKHLLMVGFENDE